MTSQIFIQNQQPVHFDLSNFHAEIDPQIDVHEYNEEQNKNIEQKIVAPLYQSANASMPVQINVTDDTQQTTELDADAVMNTILDSLFTPFVDTDLDDGLKLLIQSSMQYTEPNDYTFTKQFIMQSYVKSQLPAPAPNVVYTAGMDVIPTAKDLITDWRNEKKQNSFISSFGGLILNYPLASKARIVFCRTHKEYEAIQNELLLYTKANQQNIDADNLINLNAVATINMGVGELSASWLMPNVGSGTEYVSYSFNRIVENIVTKMQKTHDIVSPIYDIRTMRLPQLMVFINVEEYATVKDTVLMKDLNNIHRSVRTLDHLNVISLKNLSTLKAIDEKTDGNDGASKQGQIARVAMRQLRGKPYTSTEQLALIVKAIKVRKTNLPSENSYKAIKRTYMRPNRRNPDDFNLKGTIKTIKYRPDLHIYLDTSGSISEAMYKSAITNLIALAKTMKVNIYFNSFSHVISETSLLKTGHKTDSAIYKEFQSIQKVSGGTDFENVWNAIDNQSVINKRNNRAEHINFIISDMQDHVRQSYQFHPNAASVTNTYYVPIHVSEKKYESIVSAANHLIKSMKKAGHPKASKYFLM